MASSILFINYINRKNETKKVLYELFRTIIQKEVWKEIGGPYRLFEKNVLLDVLLSGVTPQKLHIYFGKQKKSENAIEVQMSNLQYNKGVNDSSHRQESNEQCTEEFADALRIMSYQIALARRKESPTDETLAAMQNMWSTYKAEVRDVSEALPEIQKIWESQYDEEKERSLFFWACRDYVKELNPSNRREDLLRALGNSVVEQTAELAFKVLLEKHLGNIKFYS